MELQKVNGKVIDTGPIKHLLRQGEANVDRIYIPVSKTYDGLDISAFAFELRAESEKDTLVKQVLEKYVGNDEIRLLWRVTPSFAAVSGWLNITIVGIGTDGAEVIKFTGDKITVADTGNVKYLPAPSLVTDILNQVTLMVNRAVSAAVAAEKSAATAENMLRDANAYTDAQVKKLLDDSIYKVPYYDPIDGAKKDLQRVLDSLAAQRFGAYTWEEREAKDLTWGEFEDKGLTWEQINKGGW